MSYEFPIDRSKVLEFARAVRATDPQHGGDAPLMPPTMLTSGRMIWEPADQSGFARLGFDRSRILHGEEEYEFHALLPRAGQTLTVETTVGDIVEKPGRRGGTMRLGSLVTEFRDEDGRLVATQRSTIIETAPRPAGQGGDR
ncbi:FAS1-like dehydratase domain-containing protein [Streptomyces sp. NPDC055078]